MEVDDKNIVLIGYRCSGKSEVGKVLASRLKRDFIDTDTLVEERAGVSIAEYVRLKGWDLFRELERRTIEEIVSRNRLVIATGGGVVLSVENVTRLKESGRLIWLKADPEILKARMVGQQAVQPRPSLTGKDPLEEIQKVLASRTLLYEQAGDFSIDTGALSIQDVVEALLKKILENPSQK